MADVSTTSVPSTHHAAHHVLMTNSLTPWLRTYLDVDGGDLTLDEPRTALGIVPTGRTRHAVALNDVTSIEVTWRSYPGRAAVALLLLGVAALLAPPTWLAVAFVVVAVWLIMLSFVAAMRVDLCDRRPLVVPICVFQRRRARRIAERVAWIQERRD